MVAEGASLFTPSSRRSPASNVSEEAIETLPTVARGIEDFARLSPYFDSQASGDGSGANALSVAGRNNRYNNIQIDGAVNNDLFGLADAGTPGGQTETQPISLDAIQEMQLVVSPYDVRQGGFSGGGINADHAERDERAFTARGTTSAATRAWSARASPTTPIADVQRQAVRGQPGRADRAGQGVLLRQRRLRPQATPTGFSVGGTGPGLRHRGGGRRAS